MRSIWDDVLEHRIGRSWFAKGFRGRSYTTCHQLALDQSRCQTLASCSQNWLLSTWDGSPLSGEVLNTEVAVIAFSGCLAYLSRASC